jgi:MYXO-CTERM domain-containing protein
MRSSRSITAVVGLAVAFAGSVARADLPPPDGQKFVPYGFRVEGVSAQTDWVLLAYPCSDSNGRPMDEYQVVSEGANIGVGRRGGTPRLYAMKRADYDAFAKTYKPSDAFPDKALADLFGGNKVVACDKGPTPVHQISSSDPRAGVTESLKLVSVDASSCHVVAVADGSAAPSATANATASPAVAPAASSTAGAPAVGTNSPVGPSDAAGDAPKSGGCAGCAVDGADGREGALVAGLGALALVIAMKRRRRP